MSELVCVSPHILAERWGEFSPHLATMARISDGRLSPGDIVSAIASGAMQLWCFGESAMLTEVLAHPQSREVHIISAVGNNAKGWREVWPSFEEWVRSERCSIITARCRDGWARVLAPLDFNECAIVLEKRLT